MIVFQHLTLQYIMCKLLISFVVFILLYPLPVLAEKEIIKSTSAEAFSMMGALNMVLGLVVVIALILGLAWILKKYARLPNSNQVDMKVLGGLSLGTREKAILIEVENTRLLVGVTPGHIQTLHVLDKLSADVLVKNSLEENSFESKFEEVLEEQK